jgi:hypothetical protein
MTAKVCRFLACGMLAMLVVGCGSVSDFQALTPTLAPTSTATLVPTTTSASFTATNQPLNFFFPKVEKRCPENREVPVDKLGIDAEMRIILSDLNQTGLWSLESNDSSPTLIQNLPMDKWTSKSISPDGKRLAYTIWNPDLSSSTWVYDLENKEQREILNIKYWEGLAPGVRWLSEQELLIINLPYQSFPLYVANVSTGDSVEVSDVEREPYDEYQTFYTITGKYYPLYSAGNVGDDYTDFYIYDYSTHQKIPIFPWLQDKIFFYPYGGTNLGLDFYLNKIFIMVEQSYGYDFGVVDTSIRGLTQGTPYDVLMKRVVTEHYFDELDLRFVALSPSSDTLLLSMSYEDYTNGKVNNNFDITPENVESAFFAVDLAHPVVNERVNRLVFQDYCLSTSEYYFTSISLDGHIVALSSDNEIMLLNLETGYRAHLPNWKFIGWAK